MAKLVLQPNPRFKGKVEIPVPGEEPATVEFTFIHRTKSALHEFGNSRIGVGDITTFLEMVCGWDLEEEFNTENVELLLQNYINVPLTTFHEYVNLLMHGKSKN